MKICKEYEKSLYGTIGNYTENFGMYTYKYARNMYVIDHITGYYTFLPIGILVPIHYILWLKSKTKGLSSKCYIFFVESWWIWKLLSNFSNDLSSSLFSSTLKSWFNVSWFNEIPRFSEKMPAPSNYFIIVNSIWFNELLDLVNKSGLI